MAGIHRYSAKGRKGRTGPRKVLADRRLWAGLVLASVLVLTSLGALRGDPGSIAVADDTPVSGPVGTLTGLAAKDNGTTPTSSAKLGSEAFAKDEGAMPPPFAAPLTIDSFDFYLQSAVGDALLTWQDYLRSIHPSLRAPHVMLVWPERAYRSACVDGGDHEYGMTADTPYALYCPGDSWEAGEAGTIWLPTATLHKAADMDIMDMKASYHIDFAGGAVGVWVLGRYITSELMRVGVLPAKLTVGAVDLMATCFTGAWAGMAYGDRVLAGNSQAAVHAILKFGKGTYNTELATTYGKAFGLAFDKSRPLACVQAYAK